MNVEVTKKSIALLSPGSDTISIAMKRTELENGQGQSIMPQTALHYDTEVKDGGRVELCVPLSPGARVTVFVIETNNTRFDDLLLASQSSLDFWDNPFDDEDWNDA